MRKPKPFIIDGETLANCWREDIGLEIRAIDLRMGLDSVFRLTPGSGRKFVKWLDRAVTWMDEQEPEL